MMWTKLTIDTTVEAVDLISAFLDEKGVEGVMIEDHVPLTEEDKAAMFVDIPLVDGVDDGTAKVSCYIDDSFNIETLRADIAAELTRLEAFITGRQQEYNTLEYRGQRLDEQLEAVLPSDPSL